MRNLYLLSKMDKNNSTLFSEVVVSLDPLIQKQVHCGSDDETVQLDHSDDVFQGQVVEFVQKVNSCVVYHDSDVQIL